MAARRTGRGREARTATGTVVRVVRDPQAMHELGRRMGAALPPGTLVALDGPLGAGKTVLTQGLADGLGIDPREVTSPSFTLCRIHAGPTTLVHIDLYRLAGEADAHDAGLLEWLDEPRDALVVVEWFERLGRAPADVRVRIAFAGPGVRRVSLTVPPAVATALRRRSPPADRRESRAETQRRRSAETRGT
ncbi:MAG: tRNA (adenosine(37)-N6)-threonylcarbamoyltransferase complex ATPase subunit type 1 TsaE [Deltaproteobacteria bacterium]|nr:tRNA (adenosine(37)-N6)-threonylcarbamoyltransferase complex ATPase subunit type 1 TsaE [Deltaproteobacteria bacterium]